jgi:hypothetical protein
MSLQINSARHREKTVGMTLNRMQAAGAVRRDGRSWFLIQKKEAAK